MTLNSSDVAQDDDLSSQDHNELRDDIQQHTHDGSDTTLALKLGKILTAGETISGDTLAVPVYQDTSDNKVYACDGNDLTKLKFLGFAITDADDTEDIKVQTNGIVGGFSGLSEGVYYYVQDTAGTIGTAKGTYECLVGIAISETELLILKNNKGEYRGSESFSDSIPSSTVGNLTDTVTLPGYCTEAVVDITVSVVGGATFGGQIFVRRQGITTGNWKSEEGGSNIVITAVLSGYTITITVTGISSSPARSMSGNGYFYT